MKSKACLLLVLWTYFSIGLVAQESKYPKAKVSFEDFKELVDLVEPIRAQRLINFDTFIKMSKEPGTIILDSRSEFRYDRIHLKGAKHLSFSDFNQASLAKVIPNSQTRVLIYCNNNYEGNQVDFTSKLVKIPSFADSPRMSRELLVQLKPRMMALNVPTFINLFGYGYTNVYELDELVNVNDPRAVFEGSDAGE